MENKKKAVIAPGQHPMWGNLRAFRQDALATIEQARQAGDLVRWRFGPLWFYQANDPDLIKEVLVRKASDFHKTDRNKDVFRPVLGEGLLVSDGEFWQRQRGMVQPAFHSQRIKAYGQTMVEEALYLLDRWADQPTVELHHEMMRVTLAIVARTLFDVRLEDDEFQQVSRAMDVVLARANDRFQRIVDIPQWVPTPGNLQGKRAMANLDYVLQRIIRDRRESGEDRGDLLSILLFSRDQSGQRMTDEQARDEAMTLFLAGHETTANALTWTWTLLGRHPQVLARLQQEVDRVASKRSLTVADLEALSFHDQVVQEAMRLYPPAWIIARQSIRPVEIGPYQLPAGARIFISAWGVQRDPNLFDEPLSFQPARFSAERAARRHKYSYIPFGGGPRICIGNSFAMMEAKLVLATMVKHLRLEMRPDQDLTPEPLVTLRPAQPIPVSLHWRESESAHSVSSNAA